MKKENLFEYNNRFLRSLEKEHIFTLKDWRNAQMSVLRQYTPLTDEHQKRWFSFVKGDKNQSLFSLYAGENNKEQYIGYCGITHIDHRNKRGEISFIVDPKRTANPKVYRDDFIAVLSMLSWYGFGELGLHKLFTDTFEYRDAHIRILENFGFKKEGILRDHYYGEGKHFDSFIHSLLGDEWNIIQKKYAVKK